MSSDNNNPKCFDSSLNDRFAQNQEINQDMDALKEKMKSFTYTKMRLRAPL